MTDLEIQEQAEKMYPYKDGTSKIYTDASRSLFVKHAKWMQEQDKWISVDVKPDKEFANILLYFGGKDCSCSGYYVQEHDVFMPHSVMYRGLTVTHWQPLPSPPKT